VVDLAASKLLDPSLLRRLAAEPPVVTNAPPPSSRAFSLPVFWQIFSQVQDVANAEGRLPPAKHKTVQHIKTTGPPATSRFRRLDEAKLEAAKADFAKLERDGIIKRSSSTWSAPLHMVMKPDGSWRPCSDYQSLNLVTTPDSFCYLDNILIASSSKEEHHQHLQLVLQRQACAEHGEMRAGQEAGGLPRPPHHR